MQTKIIIIPSIMILIATSVLAADISLNLVNYQPRPAIPGNYFTATINVKNIADEDLKDVQIKIDPQGNLFSDSRDEIELDLDKDEDVDLTFTIGVDADAKTGFEELDVEYDTGSDDDSETFKIQIKAIETSLVIDSVISNPENIAPGQTADVEIVLTNKANFMLKDIVVKLDLTSNDLPFAPVGGVTERSIDSLSKNQKTKVNFKVVPLGTAASQIYKVPITFDYYDEFGTFYQNKDIISLTVATTPFLDVSVETSDLIDNKKGDVIITFVNRGLSDVKFLNVYINPSAEFATLSSSQVYIGNIDSDDTESVTFTLYPLKQSAVNIPLTINYKDSTNKDYTKDITLTARVYSVEEAKKIGLIKSSSFVTILIILIVLVVAYYIYRRFKRRR